MIKPNKQRALNDIVIDGFEKFPESHRINLKKMYAKQTFNQSNLDKLYKTVEGFRFVRQTKYPEILFTQDSTKVYVYLEKAKNNVTPNDRIILNLAKIYDYLGNKKQAENYFNQLVQNFPLVQEYYVELFQFYIKKKNTIKAKQTAVKILQKFPDFAERDLLENFINSEFPSSSNP